MHSARGLYGDRRRLPLPGLQERKHTPRPPQRGVGPWHSVKQRIGIIRLRAVAAQAKQQLAKLLVRRIRGAPIVQQDLPVIVACLAQDESLTVAGVIAGHPVGGIIRTG